MTRVRELIDSAIQNLDQARNNEVHAPGCLDVAMYLRDAREEIRQALLLVPGGTGDGQGDGTMTGRTSW